MMSMTRPCDILSMTRLFKALYLFKIREQTPFFEQKVWLFGKCSLNL